MKFISLVGLVLFSTSVSANDLPNIKCTGFLHDDLTSVEVRAGEQENQFVTVETDLKERTFSSKVRSSVFDRKSQYNSTSYATIYLSYYRGTNYYYAGSRELTRVTDSNGKSRYKVQFNPFDDVCSSEEYEISCTELN